MRRQIVVHNKPTLPFLDGLGNEVEISPMKDLFIVPEDCDDFLHGQLVKGDKIIRTFPVIGYHRYSCYLVVNEISFDQLDRIRFIEDNQIKEYVSKSLAGVRKYREYVDALLQNNLS